MNYKFFNMFKQWKEKGKEDKDILKELKKIEFNEKEIEDRFYRNLQFGTAGMRGIMGAGPNRMNIFVVRKITQAFCEFLKRKKESKSVTIAYDSRNKSSVFAIKAAEVFAANNIVVNIFDRLMAVPILSFSIRELNCFGGVMITASHNSAEYNGYKIYGKDGCQIGEEEAGEIYEISKSIGIFSGIKKVNFDIAFKKGIVRYVKKEVVEKYYENVLNNLIHKEVLKDENLKLIYTPLNGAGNEPVREVLKRAGVSNLELVKEQEKPDGNFKTCKYPNPETEEALKLGLKLCKEQKPDVLIATDPDCDRVGVAVPSSEKKDAYVVLNGNEIGVLAFHYLLNERTKLKTMPKFPVAIKTIVSSNLVCDMAEEFGVEMKNVLTGFKNIGHEIFLLEKKKEEKRFIFGFEESHGYLFNTFVRDKDGVFAVAFLCEIVAFYKKQNRLVVEILQEIYEKYGFYRTSLKNFIFSGKKGTEVMNRIMENLRKENLQEIGEFKVEKRLDYFQGVEYFFNYKRQKKLKYEKSNILQYCLNDKANLIIRPSGTEPKLKIYYTVVGKTLEKAKELEENLIKSFDLKKYMS